MKSAVKIVVCCVLIVSISGCISSKPQQSGLMQQANMKTISANELRIDVRSLARPFGGILEGVADSVLRRSPGPETEYKVLRWKTEVIPAMHAALFSEDPLAALLDAGALVEQLDQYFVEGPGSADLEADEIEVIRAGIAAMRRELKKVLVDAGVPKDEVEKFWVYVVKWAQKNPVRHTFAMRPNTTPLVSHFVANTGGGIGDAVGSMQEQISDLGSRIDLYAEYMPRQARWQAQLTAEEMMADKVLERAINQLGGGVPVSIADLPIDIAAEREIILETIRREGILVGQWVERERELAFEYVTAERIAVLETVAAERLAVIDAVEAEREAILDVIKFERRATLEELGDLVESSLHEAVISAIDHAFRRVVQLLAIVLPLFFIGCLILLWVIRRMRT